MPHDWVRNCSLPSMYPENEHALFAGPAGSSGEVCHSLIGVGFPFRVIPPADAAAATPPIMHAATTAATNTRFIVSLSSCPP